MKGKKMDFTIRAATLGDLAAINAIYNHYVLHSTCTYQEELSTEEERRGWFAAHGERHPVTVAVEEGGDGEVVGWGSLNPFHARSAYRFTTENSVYVRQDRHRKGIGGAILADLIGRATALRYRVIVALISADQAASIVLHASAGFRESGRLHGVGYKFGRWLDVVYMERAIPQQEGG